MGYIIFQIVTLPMFKFYFFLIVFSPICLFAQPNNIQSLPCGTPDNFSLGNSGFVGSNPTTAAGSCGQCCYSGSDLDGDGDQDVSYSVENSVWYEYCNSTASAITIDIVVDEVFNNCNVQGAVFVGDPNNMDVDCSNPGFQEYGSNPGGNGDGFTFTVTMNPGECAWVMIDGYGGATCSDLTIEVPCCTAPSSVSAGLDATICEGQSVTLNGSISGGLVESGGPTFSWSPITGLSCSDCQSPSASPTISTSYTLTACNDASGLACCATDVVNVDVVPAFLPDAGVDITACAPSSVTLGGSPTGPNGSSYAWAQVGPNNGGIAISAGANTANPTVSINSGATGSETYEVTVTNGPCIFTDQITVTVGPLTVDAGLQQAVCAGSSIQIGGAPTAPAGSNFSWTCISNCADVTLSSTNVSNPTVNTSSSASGTATFSVQATLGTCTNTSTVDVTLDPLPIAPLISANPLIVCAGSSSTLSASGGAGANSYTWWDAASGGTLLGSANSLTVSPLTSTTYYLESTDAATGCISARTPITINTTVAAVANAGSDDIACEGTAFNLSGSINNPEACASQSWSVVSGSGTFSPSANDLNAIFTPSSSGTVELALTPCTSGSGCPVVTDNVVLTISPAPSVTAWPENDTLCFDEGLVTTLNSTTTGGSPAPTSIVSSYSSAPGPFAIPNNDCVTGVSVPITVSGVTDPVVGTTTVSVCVNIDLNSVENIQIELCAPGGTPCVLLVPDNNGMAGNDFMGTCFSDASATNIASGTAPYTGTFTPFGTASMSDFNGVSTNGTWTLTVYDCTGKQSGELDDWAITFDTPLPNDPYTYQWSPAGNLSDPNLESPVFSSNGLPVSTVTSTVTVTDQNNCSNTADVTVHIVDCSILLDLEQPLTLLNFNGEKADRANLLQWSVANEELIHHYELERSKDGIQFNSIYRVEAWNNVDYRNYNYLDQSPGNGLKYYRLKLIGSDESIEYSSIVAIDRKGENANDFLIYPNPVEDEIQIEFVLENPEELNFKLENPLGQIVLQKRLKFNSGLNLFKIELGELSAGTYLLNISTENFHKEQKLIKK